MITVSPKALAEARGLGMFGRLPERLADMANRGMPFTHPYGNRRFESYLIKLDGEVVTGVCRLPQERPEDRPQRTVHVDAINCTICHGTKLVTQHEECLNCGGEGCGHCRHGFTVTKRPCPFAQGASRTTCDIEG